MALLWMVIRRALPFRIYAIDGKWYYLTNCVSPTLIKPLQYSWKGSYAKIRPGWTNQVQPTPLRFVIILAVIALSASACQTGQYQSGSLLFQDDFSTTSSGWLVGQDETGLVAYYGGGIRIFVDQPGAARLTVPRLSFADIRAEVDTLMLGGAKDNNFGLICRYQDAANFYFFEISSDGYYTVGKYKDGVMSLIGMSQMQSHNAINQGVAINHLRADCSGANLVFYINGKKVTGVEDQDLKSGDVGLIAGALKTAGTDILFDNFTVLQP